MNLLTIIAVAYLAIVIARAAMRGFLKTLFSVMFLVLVIATTMIFSKPMTDLFRGSENLQTFFSAKSQQFIDNGGAGRTSLGRDSSAGDVANAVVDLALGIAGVGSIEAGELTDYLMTVTATAVTFILSCIAWLIIQIVISRMKKVRAVNALDHILGVPLGAAKGILYIWVALGVVSLLSFTRVGIALAAQVEASPMLKFLYEHNLLAEGIRNLIMGALH